MSTEPIWVSHPQTNSQIDVAPFFSLLTELDEEGGMGADGARDIIRRAIRLINLSNHDPAVCPPSKVIGLYYDLHRLEDAFSAMQVQPA